MIIMEIGLPIMIPNMIISRNIQLQFGSHDPLPVSTISFGTAPRGQQEVSKEQAQPPSSAESFF